MASRTARAAGATSVLRRLHTIAVPTLASVVAGILVGGFGSRIVMRLSAIAAGEAAQGAITDAGAVVGQITAGGTIFLIVFAGLGAGAGGAGAYLATRSWLPTGRWQRALTFGALELVVFGAVVLDPSNPDFTILGHRALNVVMFASLFIAHGVVLVMLEPLSAWLLRESDTDPTWRRVLRTIVVIGLAAVAWFGILAFVLGPGPLSTVFAVGLIVCGVGNAVLDPSKTSGVRLGLRIGACACLAGVATIGTASLVDALTTIL